MRPHIYSVCDQGYFDLYGAAFVNSARAQGHTVDLFCDHKMVETEADKARYLAWRYQLLPGLVEKHKSVLMVDVDSVITRPVEIADEYEWGLFLRPHKQELHLRTMGAVLYCTERAAEVARKLAECMSAADVCWYYDQVALLAIYHGLGGRYRVKHFDRSFVSWKCPGDAPIFTGKGQRKDTNEDFAAAVKSWKGTNANIACVS